MAGTVTRQSRQPMIVVEGPRAVVDREAALLRAAGYEIVEGFRGEARRGPEVVRTGTVAGPSDAAEIVLAAISGAGVLVEGAADRDTLDRLIDDLRRLGPVDHRVVGPADGGPEVPADARALIGLLAEGYSLGEAAVILGLARRTADRRLADARRSLGVTRTTEAIARARRLGWLGPGPR